MASKPGMAPKDGSHSHQQYPRRRDYNGPDSVGSQNVPANVILDTGSSTLAIKHSVYKPTADKNLKGTKYAQDVAYGTGGWAGQWWLRASAWESQGTM